MIYANSIIKFGRFYGTYIIFDFLNQRINSLANNRFP